MKTDSAKYLAEGIRSHRGMENRLHYAKDAIMREDAEMLWVKLAGKVRLCLYD